MAYSAGRAGGFLYCVATDGVTGAREDLDPGLLDYLASVREVAELPLAVGFGISRPEHVRALRGHADGVIVGSAIIRRIGEGRTGAERRSAVATVVSELKAAC